MSAVAHPPNEVAIQKCEVCGDPMQHLGDLPKTARFPAVSVFRCHRCNNVRPEPRQRAGWAEPVAKPIIFESRN
jgi:hypothetical protein